MDVDLEIGQKYMQKEIESIFKTGLGNQLPGILPKDPGEVMKIPYLFLFSTPGNQYEDRMDGKIIYYVGHGPANKDQKMWLGNKRLAESNADGRIIFGFKRGEGEKKWTYLGIYRLLDTIVGKNENRKRIFEFKLENIDLSSPYELEDELEYVEDADPSLTSEEERDIENSKRKARSRAFSDDVKKIYDYQCAVCETKRFNRSDRAEVESAHIYPVEKNGPDKVINGISLCRLHHWAFDNGLLLITDDYHIIVHPGIKEDENFKEIYKFEGKKILLPKKDKFKPHQNFLQKHRKMHRF